MNFHIITLFPKAFDSYLSESIIARALGNKPRRAKRSGSRLQASGKIKVIFYNPRDFTKDKWKRIDQKPYSGGPGMVIQALPVAKAIEKALASIKKRVTRKNLATKIIWLTPGGKQFDTAYAKKSAKYTDIIIVSGRYEGIDARVKKVFQKKHTVEDVSIGPYVVTGGELPAMILIDSIARQIEGVSGNFDSLEESRVSSHDVYTRPEVFEYKGKKYKVPKVLLSGDHKKIEAWKQKK